MRHGLPTIRQFIWIWESLQRPFGSCCLEFYFPRHSVASPLPPSLSLFLSLSLLYPCRRPVLFLSLSFFFLSPRFALSLPRSRFRGIALPGISEVLSRIQGLPSSLTDGSTILFYSRTSLRALTSRRPSSCSAPFPASVTIRPLGGRLSPRRVGAKSARCSIVNQRAASFL